MNQSSIVIPWNSTDSHQEFEDVVLETTQWNRAPSLYRATQELVLRILSDHTLRFSSIIFVTDTSDFEDLGKAVSVYQDFLKPRVFLNLIAFGEKVEIQKLAGFEVEVFDWRNLKHPSPENWNLTQAIGCGEHPLTITQSLSPQAFSKPFIFKLPSDDDFSSTTTDTFRWC